MSLINKKTIIRIGVVEDHAVFRKAIIQILSSYKHLEIILEATNGIDLLRQLKKYEPDILLLDLDMPEMNGTTVLNVIKDTYPSIKVIIFSLHDDATLVSDLLNLGACCYVSKVDSPQEISSMIVSCKQQALD